MNTKDNRLIPIADVLLGAAYADGALDAAELLEARRILADLHHGTELPAEVERHITSFDPSKFDLASAAAAFKNDSPQRKRRLLEMVATMREADGEFDFAEDDYLCALGDAIGVPREDFADLSSSIEIELLREDFVALTGPPPPPPPLPFGANR